MTGDLYEMATELEQAAELEGAELGEWWSALAGLVPRVFDGASEEFQAAFEKELRAEYKRLKEEFRIKEWTDTETRTIAHRELQHESEWDD
jgi:hypothetical protein